MLSCDSKIHQLMRSRKQICPLHLLQIVLALGSSSPKLEVPTFDGNLLNWKQFWGQFHALVHDRTSLSSKSTEGWITKKGLSRSGEHYAEAIGCFKSHPQLIHQTHVKMVLETPPLHEGNGKELRCLHDTMQQHLCALRSMDYEPSAPFITSLLKLKLDATTMFEWQCHTQVKELRFQNLFDFINANNTFLSVNYNKITGNSS